MTAHKLSPLAPTVSGLHDEDKFKVRRRVELSVKQKETAAWLLL